MIFDTFTLVAIIAFVAISVFIISSIPPVRIFHGKRNGNKENAS